jgi:hypothetical protein
MSGWESPQSARLRAELQHDPALVERILGELPAVAEQNKIVIRTDAASVDLAVARALALTTSGAICRLELMSDGRTRL